VEHNKNSRMRNWFLLTVSIAFLGSCASMKTSQDQYVESVPLAVEGAYDQAALIIEAAKEEQYKEKDRVLYFLDLGMLYHWSGEYELSNQMLSAAESAIEELFTKSVSKALTSGVLNDNALDYSGEDYEDIYLNVFKALNYIALDDEESALVEIRTCSNQTQTCWKTSTRSLSTSITLRKMPRAPWNHGKTASTTLSLRDT
jgi:hypothetical protein